MATSDAKQRMGGAIREARLRMDMTQAEAGKRLESVIEGHTDEHVSQSRWSHWERGLHAPPEEWEPQIERVLSLAPNTLATLRRPRHTYDEHIELLASRLSALPERDREVVESLINVLLRHRPQD